MQGVSELMEHRGDLVPGEQRGLTLWCLGAVAHIKDNGQLLTLTTLFCEVAHPRATTFGGTTEVVTIEECQRLTVLVDDLEDLHVRMVCGNVCTLLECQAIDAVGSIEHTIDEHAVDIEIRLHLVFRDIQHLLLHLLRIVEAVVGLQLEVGTLRLAGKVLDGFGLSLGLRRIFANQVLEEGIDVFRCLGHRLLQRIRSIVGIAHNLCLFCTQLGNLYHDGEGVVLTSAVGSMDRSLVNLLAQLTVVEAGQQSLLCGVDDDDGIGSFAASALSILGTLGDIGFAETCQIFFLIYPHDCIVGGSRKLITPLCLQLRDAQVDFLHAGHLVIRQQGTLAYKVLIGFLQ